MDNRIDGRKENIGKNGIKTRNIYWWFFATSGN